MNETVSVEYAIIRGRWIVNFPAAILFIGSILGSVFLYNLKYYEGWIVAIGFIFAVVLPSVYRSFVKVKWRIWAYENVINLQDLKRKAIQNKLMSKEGSWIEKTEFKSEKDKDKLKRIERKFLKNDIYRDDISIPKLTLIYLSRNGFYVGVFVILVILVFGVYLVFEKRNYLGLLSLPSSIYFYLVLIKKYTDKSMQLALNNEYIVIKEYGKFKWEFIKNEEVVFQHILVGNGVNYYLSFDYKGKKIVKCINDLTISDSRLEKLIKVYRIRFIKSFKSL